MKRFLHDRCYVIGEHRVAFVQIHRTAHYDGQVRATHLGCQNEPEPVEVRHVHVGADDVDFWVEVEETQRLFAVVALEHARTGRFEYDPQQHTHGSFVFSDENCYVVERLHVVK
ncbi:MAG: hypothetical protein JWN41_1106 [Thermoleophilia bacterium]|nr:hypothetical protein [Thermoleophilia bacterium]